MTAKNYLPKMVTTSTGSGSGSVTHKYQPGSGKRWLFDYIELEHSVAAAGNTVDIQVDDNDGGSPANIWPQVLNFLKMNVDLRVRFPRGVEIEATDAIEIVFARGTATTAVSRVYVQERDL